MLDLKPIEIMLLFQKERLNRLKNNEFLIKDLQKMTLKLYDIMSWTDFFTEKWILPEKMGNYYFKITLKKNPKIKISISTFINDNPKNDVYNIIVNLYDKYNIQETCCSIVGVDNLLEELDVLSDKLDENELLKSGLSDF